MKKMLFGIIIFGLIIIVAFLVVYYSIANAFGLNDKTYTQSELIENYKLNESKILKLSQYFNSICPTDKIIEIEFEDDDKISRLSISSQNNIDFQEWNLDTNSDLTESIITTIHWNSNTLKSIKKKLDEANCISISNDEPIEIGFRRSGLGMYSFLKLKKPMNDSLKKFYKENCEYLIYNERVVLKYAGGAIDSDCFPENFRK